MKFDQDDRLESRGVLNRPRECYAESLGPPAIVGEVPNPAFEAVRCFWWRAFDRVCYPARSSLSGIVRPRLSPSLLVPGFKMVPICKANGSE